MSRHFLGVLSLMLLTIAFVEIERYQPLLPNNELVINSLKRKEIANLREALRAVIKHDQFVLVQPPPEDIREWAIARIKIAVEQDQDAQKQEEGLRERETELLSLEENKVAANAFSSRIIAIAGFLGLIAGALQTIFYMIAAVRGSRSTSRGLI